MDILNRLHHLHELGETDASLELIVHYYRLNDPNQIFTVLDHYIKRFPSKWKVVARFVWDRKESIIEQIQGVYEGDLSSNTTTATKVSQYFAYYFFFFSTFLDTARTLDVDLAINSLILNPFQLNKEDLRESLDSFKRLQDRKDLRTFRKLKNRLLVFNFPTKVKMSPFPMFEIAFLPEIPLTQIRERRYDIIERAQMLAESTLVHPNFDDPAG